MENLSDNFEFERVRATAEAAKISADRSNRGVRALETSVKKQGHYAAGSVIVVAFLSMVVVGGAWWVNTRLQAQGSSLTEILGLQTAIETLNRRMGAAEVAISTIPAELRNVTGRVDALDKKGTTVRLNPKPATPEQETQIKQLNDQIATLQAQHSADTSQIDSLRGEVATLKQDTNSQIANVRSSIPGDASEDVAGLRAGIASLARSMDRDRSDFEVSQGHASEVVPGILMTIKETDVGKQEVSGWLYLQHERRFVHLKNQGLMRPITVYGGSEKQVHDIVITRVRKSYAIGYVLSPKEDRKSAELAAGGN